GIQSGNATGPGASSCFFSAACNSCFSRFLSCSCWSACCFAIASRSERLFRVSRRRVLLKVARVLLHFLRLFQQLLKVGIVHRIVLRPKERDEENATDNENGKESRLSGHWKRIARLPGILQIQMNDRRRSGVASKCFRSVDKAFSLK